MKSPFEKPRNLFRPSPARPLVAYFIMNIMIGYALAWATLAWFPKLEKQLSPVEVVIKATPGTDTRDIVAAIHSLGRRDIQIVPVDNGIHAWTSPSPFFPYPYILGVFVLTAPFYLVYGLAYGVVARFD